MTTSDYDAEGCAAMVGKDLMLTLGMSREEVGRVFCHAIYDGVYCTKEETVKGGGSLSLINHFSEWCGLNNHDVTGYWDAGHRLQLVFGDAIKQNKSFQNFNQLMYDVMSKYSSGKNSLIFRETADSLLDATLTNKSKQETRWVRAELRSIQAFLRNVPVFYHVIGKEIQECCEENDLTGQKHAQRHQDDISSAYNLLFAIGLCQVLETYAKASLDSQRMSSFPTTVKANFNCAKNISELECLSNK